MRAMQVTEVGGSLHLVEVPEPCPDVGEVKVAVRRCGVNYPDLLLVEGRYQARPELPFGPGLEVAGEVVEVGEGVDRFEVGDRVVAFMLHGGFAEVVVVPEGATRHVPESVDDEQACVVPVAYGTSYHALVDRAGLKPGDSLVVLGAAGGVGMTAVEIGKMLGARVIACVGSEAKAQAVRHVGADDVIDYSTEDVRERVLELTIGKGVDVVYDPIGGEATTDATRYLAWRGRLLVIGFTSGEIPQIPANRLLLKGTSAVGVYWGLFTQFEPEANHANLDALLDAIAVGRLSPHISRVLRLEEAPEALASLAARSVIGKLVLAVE